MIQPSTPLLFLLECVKQAGSLETYFFFPELILAGTTRIERTDFDYLVSEAYVKETGSDNFGKQYALTLKSELILSDSFYSLPKEGLVVALN
jgi:hypothetical protein